MPAPEGVDEVPVGVNTSFLARTLAGLGRLLTGSGSEDAERKKRRRRRQRSEDEIEVVPIFHLGADDS